MSECDLPDRLDRYGGNNVLICRIAIAAYDLASLPTFPAKDNKRDPRYKWFVRSFGRRCCELDAMDPNDLRARVEDAIKAEIAPEAWKRSAICRAAEQESLQSVLDKWVQR